MPASARWGYGWGYEATVVSRRLGSFNNLRSESTAPLSAKFSAIAAMVARIGLFATTSRKPRQARKGATVAAMSGAEVRLVRVISTRWRARFNGVEATPYEQRREACREEGKMGPGKINFAPS
jgi:hypothetical protein